MNERMTDPMIHSTACQPLLDAHGRSLADVRKLLGEDRSVWPRPEVVKKLDGDWSLQWYHNAFHSCWLCGVTRGSEEFIRTVRRLEVHHIAGGYSRKRINAPWNFAVLCDECHANVAGNLPQVLWAKLVNDREGTDFCRLTIAYRFFLPEPECER
jgi:hypothetical protein